MSTKKTDIEIYAELAKASMGRTEGGASRVKLTIALSVLAMFVIPPTYVLGWLAIILALQAVDLRIFRVLAEAQARGIPTRQAKLLGMVSVGFFALSYVSLSVMLWQFGGFAGKLFAVLFLNGAIVHTSAFLSQARFLYVCSVSPYIIGLVGLPLSMYFFGEQIFSIYGLVGITGAALLCLFSSLKSSVWMQKTFQEQEKAQKATLREKEKAERANAHLLAVDHALNEHAMVARADLKGIILSVNDAFCENTQYSSNELVGNHFTMLDSGFHPDEFFIEMQKTLDTGAVWSGNIQNKKKDGSVFWGGTTLSPVKNNAGEVIEYITIRRDITDLLDAREEAERANQAKSDFLAMMSHELRTPMNAVLGMASLLKATELNELQRDYITAVTDGGEMLMTVLNDILDLSKIEAGKLEIETINVDVRHAIDRLERLWGPNAKDKGIRFVCEIDETVPSVIRGDITRIRQVIYNLLSNAVKFTDEGEVRLTVSADRVSADKSNLTFAIQDTGVGISREAQTRLFTSFEQADKSITRKFGGTGLGLAISRKLAHLMGGDITVSSELGKGTCFTFSLEAKTVTGQSAKTEAAPEAQKVKDGTKNKRRQLRILVAEDNALNQKVLNAFLKPFNHEIIMVNDGVEALEQLAVQSFDLVLMDIQMPRKDGLTATQDLRASGGPNQDVQVIAMTANAMSGDRESCLAAGMNDYVAKPIDPRLLFSAIARASAQSRQLKDESPTKKTA